MLKDNLSVRFAENDTVIPNFELKFPKADTDIYSIENSVTVNLAGRFLQRLNINMENVESILGEKVD